MQDQEMDHPPSVLAALRLLLATEPRRRLFTFVGEDGNDEASMTVEDLAHAVSGVAASLRSWSVRPGDRVLLVFPPSLEFVEAFVGCLAAGVVPVPVYPPSPFKPGRDLAGFRAIAESSGARAALTSTEYDRARRLGAVGGLLGQEARWPRLSWHRVVRNASMVGADDAWHEPDGPDEPAFLQYTSGSTATPKGVVISHGNLAHEIVTNAADLGLGDGARGVFWVPQYHDLGLISVILSTVAGNSETTLLSPLTFLHRPAVWFDVMSRVRATHTAAPNFAFDLAVRRTAPHERRKWDLTSLRVVMSAAEPIRAATVDRFYAAFAPSGLDPATFYPAYGLAEHTVSVAMGGTERLRVDRAALEAGTVIAVGEDAKRESVELVGCGRVTKPTASVRIVDPETYRPCGAGEIGEIWVDSPTKALGYHGMPEETAATFHATVVGDGDPRTYLRTGDLGFLHDGGLYVTGRRKDLIIVRGRNLHPGDLEESVRDCHPAIRPGGVAAFGVPTGDDAGEGVVVFVEARKGRVTDAQADEIAASVRSRVHAEHRLACHAVVVGTAGLVRKTTSGKLRRRACAEAFLSGEATAPDRTYLVTGPDRSDNTAGVGA